MKINVESKTAWWVIGLAAVYFLYVRGRVPAAQGQAIDTDGPWRVVA